MKIKLLPVVVLAATILFLGCGSNEVSFKFNVPKGAKFSYSVGMDMNANQAMMGQEMKINSKITFVYLFEVLNDSAGWKTIRSTINRIGMNVNGGGIMMKIDTDSTNTDTTGPMAKIGQIFGAMKGGQFTFTMNENGEVGQMTGMQEMVQKISNSMGADAAVASETMSKVFNEQAFKQNLQQSFAMYPGKPVKPGESWNKTLTMDNNGMIMKLNNTYTLDSAANGVARVRVASIITSGGDAPAAGPQTDMSGELKGINYFDLPTGMPLSGNDNMVANIKMHAQGQEMSIKLDNKITIEGKKQ
jgi:hypothetical protein